MNKLKVNLQIILLPPLIALLCGELWLSQHDLRGAADAAYDRSLAGVIKAIDTTISTASGGVAMELPYPLLDFFQLSASGRVYYRVATGDGLVTLGNADLPEPQIKLEPGVPYFFNAEYFGEPIRVGAYVRRLLVPLYDGASPQSIVIEVAEGTKSRTSFVQGLLLRSALMDTVLVAMVAIIMSAGVAFVLRPLQRVRKKVLARAPNDFTAVEVSSVPFEVRPLIDAINGHVKRFQELTRSQQNFLDDASHQLRTPLAVLRTQVDYALREPRLPQVREALTAMQKSVDRSARLVNQLLALARANNTASLGNMRDKVNVCAVIEDVARLLLPEARGKQQDFGFYLERNDVLVAGSEALLHEAIVNLVDNAIRHVQLKGHVTLTVERIGEVAQITVADNGPGMTDQDKSRMGERFHRGKSAATGGAGLGLAITMAIIEQHSGTLEVSDGLGGVGLTVRVILPVLVTADPLAL